MQIKQEFSYGIVCLHKDGDRVKIFLINQYGNGGKACFWGIPKGHVEGNENPLETAKREVLEETNLSPSIVNTEQMYLLEYEFVRAEVLVKKQAGYFVGWVHETSYVLQKEEIKEAGWFTFEEAKDKFEFERYRDLLEQVEKNLDK